MVLVYAGSDTLPSDAEEIDDDAQMPSGYSVLHQNYPIPFNSSAAITVELWGISDRHVELLVFNTLGQRTRTLFSGSQQGRLHTVCWDGMDALGKPVASRVYYDIPRADQQQFSRKMILLKQEHCAGMSGFSARCRGIRNPTYFVPKRSR